MKKVFSPFVAALLLATGIARACPVALPSGHNAHASFRARSSGTETVLHSFTGAPDGRFPEARIMRDGSGDLWGITYAGGGKCNCGII